MIPVFWILLLLKATGFVPSHIIKYVFTFFSSCVSLTADSYVLVIIFLVSATDEEVIFRNFDGDILKVNTNNQTELLMKNTTFVRFFYSGVHVVLRCEDLSENCYYC